LGERLRAIHVNAMAGRVLDLLPLCTPDAACQTTACFAFAAICDLAASDLSLLPAVLPTITAMRTSSFPRCIRMARVPLLRLIRASPEHANALAALASEIGVDQGVTRKRPRAPLVPSQTSAEQRLVHERLDMLPMTSQVELIMRCTPSVGVEPGATLDRVTASFARLLTLLHEQNAARLRDPRLRSAPPTIDTDLQVVVDAFAKIIGKDGLPVPAAAAPPVVIERRTVPDIPVLPSTDEYRTEQIEACFDRVASAATRSPMAEAIAARLVASVAVDRVPMLIERFRQAPVEWCSALLQLCYALVGKGLDALYESVLLDMVETLLSVPPAELSRLLCQCPVLPKHVVETLDRHIVAEGGSGARMVALFALRDVVMKRPADRSAILDVVLSYCASSNAILRKTAVNLIATQLAPSGPAIQEPIVAFATRLFGTMSEPFEREIEERVAAKPEPLPGDDRTAAADRTEAQDDKMEIDGDEQETTGAGAQVDTGAGLEPPERSGDDNNHGEPGSEQGQSKPEDGPANAADGLIEAEAHRRLDLYFALCAGLRPDLLHGILAEFALVSARGTRVRASIHKHIVRVVRAIGVGSPAMIDAIASGPPGAEPLVLHILHILTESADGGDNIVHPALVDAARVCYGRARDARFLIPVISGMKRADVLDALPHIIALPKNHVQQAFKVLLGARSPVSPSEVLVRLHLVAPTPDHPLLRKVLEAIELCILDREAYNEKVLAVVLQQIVEHTPIPVLFMRTLIQVIVAHPLLTDFGMSILAKLVNKRIWDMPVQELWQGFVVCCKRTAPQSFPVMLQLPSQKLAHIIDRSKDPEQLRNDLARFVQNSRIGVRRSIMSVLGLSRRTR
ncbi:hypothetical protein PBRA_000972, partial [Plasmodiophora brassicae]